MLFNSYTFIFAFLPVALLGYLVCVHLAPRAYAIRWLILCSLFFYGWWQPQNLWILLFLLFFNYGLGVCLGRLTQGRAARLVLIAGLAVNLGMLCYYKYANFFAGAVNDLAGTHFKFAAVVLPLGISFFIFQKIAYLVDAYRHKVRGYSLTDYSLFVTFFPQLIAGPIVHHSEVVPQFSGQREWRPRAADFSVGLTQFSLGLFKKVVLADGVAQFANPVFDAARSGAFPSFFDSWIGALAYTFQLYFDFSGYSDMALGLARLFGIKLPQNFNSPYKAASIADFWRRWHMTLSRFLRDYLYIPLGGNRKGPARRVPQSHDHDVVRWSLARSRLDFCLLGRFARALPFDSSRLATYPRPSRFSQRGGVIVGIVCFALRDLLCGFDRVGFLSRCESFDRFAHVAIHGRPQWD